MCVLLDWRLERAQKCIHFSILPAHTIESTDHMLDDLKSCIPIAKVRHTNNMVVYVSYVCILLLGGPVIVW